MTDLFAPQNPPKFCQYVDGSCNQTFLPQPAKPSVFFAYPSDPPQIAEAIENAADSLRRTARSRTWSTWKSLTVHGQIIFCEICKGFRASSAIVADVTTLNFNLLYEIGFAIGLGIPVVLIRDTNCIVDEVDFSALGILDTIGYEDFSNSQELAALLPTKIDSASPIAPIQQRAFRESPIYMIRPPIATEGSLQLESTLKKSRLRFRTFDPNEVPRLTFNEARRQVTGSLAVICTLMPSMRKGSRVHNGLCAFVAGLAMAQQKVVVLLQDGTSDVTPIDYRDIVLEYRKAAQIPKLVQPRLNQIYDVMQSGTFDSPEANQLGILKTLDLGDVAAENEIAGLRQYFVPTGPSITARQGHARLVVGRKGSGKTAIFYEIRDVESTGSDRLVLDLKPEGHQFLRLREFIEAKMPEGLQQYTLVAFWTYLLLSEIARKLLEADERLANRDPRRFEAYRKLEQVYEGHDPGSEADFSQRLFHQVSRILTQLQMMEPDEMGARMTEIIYAGDVRVLREAVSEYVAEKDAVWLLVDNLDKGWPIRGAKSTDILLIRALLDATRKLQQMFEGKGVELKSLVFLRSDIYEHLLEEIPDKGKDTAVSLEWEDPAMFEAVVARRVSASTDLAGDFRDAVWPKLCVPLVGAEDSFSYIVDRTLMRPRDLLLFLRKAIDTAINRGRSRILEEDILFAEARYSNEMLRNTEFEILDTNPELAGALNAFQGASSELALSEAKDYLEVYLDVADADRAHAMILKLIWYGFFGLHSPLFNGVQYAFAFPDFGRLTFPLENDDATLIIHPAFRSALNIRPA